MPLYDFNNTGGAPDTSAFVRFTAIRYDPFSSGSTSPYATKGVTATAVNAFSFDKVTAFIDGTVGQEYQVYITITDVNTAELPITAIVAISPLLTLATTGLLPYDFVFPTPINMPSATDFSILFVRKDGLASDPATVGFFTGGVTINPAASTSPPDITYINSARLASIDPAVGDLTDSAAEGAGTSARVPFNFYYKLTPE